jgi:hypothetical protein
MYLDISKNGDNVVDSRGPFETFSPGIGYPLERVCIQSPLLTGLSTSFCKTAGRALIRIKGRQRNYFEQIPSGTLQIQIYTTYSHSQPRETVPLRQITTIKFI